MEESIDLGIISVGSTFLLESQYDGVCVLCVRPSVMMMCIYEDFSRRES